MAYVIVRETPSTNIRMCLSECQRALSDEIAEVRKNGGQKNYLTDGRYIGRRNESYIYSFACDVELHFPDDAPIDLEFDGQRMSGFIQSIAGFDLVLALPDSIGENPKNAILFTEPWFLLEELKERLSSLFQSDERMQRGQSLFEGQSFGYEGKWEETHDLLRQIGSVKRINSDQAISVAHTLANRVSYIWGPPGTGKTASLGLAVAALVQSGKTVLVAAHSNVAVDVALLSATRLLCDTQSYKQGKMLRFGPYRLDDLDEFPLLTARGILRQVEPERVEALEKLEKQRQELIRQSRRQDSPVRMIQEKMDRIKVEISIIRDNLRKVEEDLVGSAQVLGCTLCKAAISDRVYERQFDAVLVDEASMSSIPQCIFASSLASEHVGIYGDFRQLAPIAQAETTLVERWLKRDVFDHAGIIANVDLNRVDKRMVLLSTQYRMHSAIAAIPNKLSYSGKLKNGPDVDRNAQPITAILPCENQALVNLDTSDLEPMCFQEKQSYSRFNPLSALVAVGIAYNSYKSGQQSIGIVTPYNAQSRLSHRLLNDLGLPQERVIAATVHRFQGSERDMMIFDTVEGFPMGPGIPVKGGDGSSAKRLMNVAISRTRGKFVSIYDKGYVQTHFRTEDALRQLLNETEKITPAQTLKWPGDLESVDHSFLYPGFEVYSDHHVAKAAIGRDLSQVVEEIAVVWPDCETPFSLLPANRVGLGAVRCFVTGGGGRRIAHGLKNTNCWQSNTDLVWGILGIDRKSLWIFIDPYRSSSSVIRLNLPGFIALLYAFMRLIPEDEARRSIIQQRCEAGQSPVGGSCPKCRGLLWPKWGRYRPYMVCQSGCGYTRAMNKDDVTDWARVNKLSCDDCGGQAVVREGRSGLFFGCSNYPKCHWTKSIESTFDAWSEEQTPQ